MGAKAVETLAAMPEFTRIVVADIDVDAAHRVAQKCGDKVEAKQVDVLAGDLAHVLPGAWGCLNTLGPFTRFGRMCLAAAIDAGCHYVDIMDDWEPTLEALKLSTRAADRDVTALIGMGASPGISNLLAVLAAIRVQNPTEIVTGWPMSSIRSKKPAAKPAAATVHFAIQVSGTITLTRNGVLTQAAPNQPITINYPGFGPVHARTMGHPEAVTLPRQFPSVRSSCTVMTADPWFFTQLDSIVKSLDAGDIGYEEAAAAIVNKRVQAANDLANPPDPHGPGLWAWARNDATAVGAVITSTPPGGMAGSTAIPAAVGLQLLAQGKVTARGVVTPEEAVDPTAFFDVLAPYCPDVTNAADLVRITSSTDT